MLSPEGIDKYKGLTLPEQEETVTFDFKAGSPNHYSQPLIGGDMIYRRTGTDCTFPATFYYTLTDKVPLSTNIERLEDFVQRHALTASSSPMNRLTNH